MDNEVKNMFWMPLSIDNEVKNMYWMLLSMDNEMKNMYWMPLSIDNEREYMYWMPLPTGNGSTHLLDSLSTADERRRNRGRRGAMMVLEVARR